MEVQRVVVDTNVWISGLLWKGKPHSIILLARSGVIRVVYCESMLTELLAKLRDAFDFPLAALNVLEAEIRSLGELVEITESLRVVVDDPDDDKFLECALVGQVPILISGDRHLLSIKSFRSINVMSPSEFLTSISPV